MKMSELFFTSICLLAIVPFFLISVQCLDEATVFQLDP